MPSGAVGCGVGPDRRGRWGLGSLVMARREHPGIVVDVEFDRSVSMTVPRSFRKALEMSKRRLSLLCDGREIYGLGHLAGDVDHGAEDCFVAKVVGNGSWELWHDGIQHLRVDNGIPSLPQESMDADTFLVTVRRVFPHSPPHDAEVLWELAATCTHQARGTTLVVHPDTAAEGERLLPQAQTITPRLLGPRAFEALTTIDGAILVSPTGVCHAVGVILDGAATGTGDSARGARYSSAIRYLASAGKGSMVIIVSEDGKIDLPPP